MAWQTPKTDWHGATDSAGNYTGDRFNAADFNRIKTTLTTCGIWQAACMTSLLSSPLGKTAPRQITSTLTKSISLRRI